MLLSSGVVWRYRDWERFRSECPGGDPELQRLVWERLDEDLAWLEALGAPVVTSRDRQSAHDGCSLRSRGLTEVLAQRAGDLRLGEPLTELSDGVPMILATGGFQGDPGSSGHITPEARNLVLRANPWSRGDGLGSALGQEPRPRAWHGRVLRAHLAPRRRSSPRTSSRWPRSTPGTRGSRT